MCSLLARTDALQALKTVDMASFAAIAAGTVAVFVFVARTVLATAVAGAAPQPLLSATNLWLAAGLGATVLLYRLLQGYRQKLFFVDYVHAHKD